MTLDILDNKGYVLREKVSHTEFNSFLWRKGWKNSRLKDIYYLFGILYLGMASFYFFSSPEPMVLRLLFMGFGFLLAFLLVPLHEYLHSLAYRFLGASNVVIVPYWRQWMVMTHADRFVVGKAEMKWIALTPFVTISIVGLLLLTFGNVQWQLLISAAVLFHTSICQSDFRILDYFRTSSTQVVMFDDMEEGVTFIYHKREQDKNPMQ